MRHRQRNVMASGINNQFNIRRYFDCKFCVFLYYNFWLKCCYIISISSIEMLFDISSKFCLHLKYTLHRRNIKTWSLDRWVYHEQVRDKKKEREREKRIWILWFCFKTHVLCLVPFEISVYEHLIIFVRYIY